MPVARPESSDSRVIAHVDMDCFYVQVEQRKQPTLRGLPTAVVQYNSWKGGSLIAVGYEARKYGVKRSMRGNEAKKVCPDIQLVQVPVSRGKADLTVYRNAGSEVVSILSRKGRCERASIDEVYLDLTEAAEKMLAENSPENMESICEEALKAHVLGLRLDGANNQYCVKEWFCSSNSDRRDKLLACGALIVAELRLEVLKETEFTCSAGIAHNKMLAKLASGMNKPAQQTIVPLASVNKLLESLPIKKMKQLGGKLGTSLQVDLCVNSVGDLLQFSEENMQERYGINTGTWLWNIARGICGDEVKGRLLPQSHGSGKTFPGPQALKTVSSVQKWLYELCGELSERLLCDLEQNKRMARTLTLHASAYKLNNFESLKKFPSKSCPLRYGLAKIQEDAFNLFHAGLRDYTGVYNARMKESKHHEWAITGLSVSASKIFAIPSGTHPIMKYFHNQNQTCSSTDESGSLLSSGSICCYSGTRSCTVHLADLQNDCYEDETKVDHVVSGSRSDGDEIEFSKADMHTAAVADCQDPPLFRMGQNMRLPEETPLSYPGVSDANLIIAFPFLAFPLLSYSQLVFISGGENGLGSKLTQSKMDFIQHGLKSKKQKRKFEQKKGTSSILRFLRSNDPCSLPEHASGTSSSGKLLQENQQALSTCNLGQDPRNDAWSYKSDEIDPCVLNELPSEIQAEVCAWLQPQKRANIVKRGSTIIHYFSPTANS